ncbi:MAG: [Fe-Fe] hydrogenase large subunit C-terminal domain-containing protein [Candidatus Edwardsbacteria bacterium]
MTENEYLHSIRIDGNKCVGCVICMKACPTKAIRVRNDKAKVLGERCIDCGECLRVCPYEAVVSLTTSYSEPFKKFKYAVALPSPVLYGQFDHAILPDEILLGLKRIGFHYVCDEAGICEISSAVIEEYLEKHPQPRPMISSTCPVIVRLIQRHFPSLCELIIPIEPPRENAAKLLRGELARELNLKEEEIGIVHITPCPAKMVSINRPATMEKSHLDGAISIRDIYPSLLSSLKYSDEELIIQQLFPTTSHSGIGIGWALSGGEVRGLKTPHAMAVSGVRDTIKVLDEIEAGRHKDVDYLECLVCPDGCIGGPLTVENRFLAKSNIMRLIKLFGEKSHLSKETLQHLYKKEDFFSFERKVSPTPLPPLDDVPSKAIKKMKERDRLVKELPGKQCGACGAPDCETLAEDIVRGKAKITDCVFKKRNSRLVS